MVPTFYHGQSRSQDQGIFFIHCHLDVILEAGVLANSLLPATETFDHEATVPLDGISAGFTQVSTCRY